MSPAAQLAAVALQTAEERGDALPAYVIAVLLDIMETTR